MRSRWIIALDIVCRALEAASRRGEAHRRRRYAAWGWVGGGHPSAPIQARTAASDGQRASTRAARSAGLRFAVILLSKAMDRETTRSGACVGTSSTANAVPLPLVGEGLSALEVERDCDCRTLADLCYLVSGLRSLIPTPHSSLLTPHCLYFPTGEQKTTPSGVVLIL